MPAYYNQTRAEKAANQQAKSSATTDNVVPLFTAKVRITEQVVPPPSENVAMAPKPERAKSPAWRGYFSVERNPLDDPFLKPKGPYTKMEAWIWLLSKRPFKDRDLAIDLGRHGHRVFLKAGQLSFSLDDLAKAWGWTKRQAQAFVEAIEKRGWIVRAVDGQNLITIIDHDPQNRGTAFGTANGTANHSPTDSNHSRNRNGLSGKGTAFGTASVTTDKENNEGQDNGVRTQEDILSEVGKPPPSAHDGMHSDFAAKDKKYGRDHHSGGQNHPPGGQDTNSNPSGGGLRAGGDRPAPPPKYTAAFEAFWLEYPDRQNNSKRKAFKEWKKLGASDREDAMESLAAFNQYCFLNRDYRVVHCERYLRDRRFEGWMDEVSSSPPKKKWFNV